MPVTCRNIKGAWRLVDKDGSIKHKAKHKTRAKCMKQARAINVNIELADDPLVYLSPKDSAPWVFFSESQGKFLYEKELIYEGAFQAKGLEFSVDKEVLSNWVKQFNGMISAGIEVPVPIEHTSDPEKNRGFLRGLRLSTREDGTTGLVGIIEFRDEEAAKLATSTDVSLYSPSSFTDGKGRKFVRPIRHVALTNYPVIPGLDGFQPIAASLIPEHKEPEMALSDLAASIGLKLSDDLSDEKINEEIVGTFNGLTEKVSKLELSLTEARNRASDKEPIKVSKAQVEMFKENRELKLSRLTESGKITPAVADKLKEVFCTDKGLELCLSLDTDDKFNEVITAIGENEAVLSFGEATKGQIRRPDGQDSNPLLAEANRRAKVLSN